MAQYWGLSNWRPDIAIDLGTATTRVTSRSQGLIARTSMYGNTHALRSGVVVNTQAVVAVLEPILSKIKALGILRPRAVVCAPTDVNATEREAVIESVVRSGASAVVVVPEPLAAAVGAEVDIVSPYAQMVVDIGEGVTDCAIIRSAKIIDTAALRGGCCALRETLQNNLFHRHNIRITRHQAEQLVRSGLNMPENDSLPLQSDCGCDYNSETQYICPEEISKAVEPVIESITGLIKDFISQVPHSIGAEIIENGITLTGGGTMLRSIRDRIRTETGVAVNVVNKPLDVVVQGAYAMLPIVAALNMWKR